MTYICMKVTLSGRWRWEKMMKLKDALFEMLINTQIYSNDKDDDASCVLLILLDFLPFFHSFWTPCETFSLRRHVKLLIKNNKENTQTVWECKKTVYIIKIRVTHSQLNWLTTKTTNGERKIKIKKKIGKVK